MQATITSCKFEMCWKSEEVFTLCAGNRRWLQVEEGDTKLAVEVWNANTIQDEVIGHVQLEIQDDKTFKTAG
jgi:hypothetical protein